MTLETDAIREADIVALRILLCSSASRLPSCPPISNCSSLRSPLIVEQHGRDVGQLGAVVGRQSMRRSMRQSRPDPPGAN